MRYAVCAEHRREAREEPVHRLRLGGLFEASMELVVERARAVHRGDVLRDACEVGRPVLWVAERRGERRGEVGAPVETEHGDDAPREERLDDLGVAIRGVAVRPLRPRLAAQDLALEPAKILARLDADVVERGAGLSVGLESLCRAARLMASRHQQVPDLLPQRMLLDERLELGDDVGGVSELDVGRDPLLDRDQAELVEPASLALRPLLEGELGERWAAPEIERPDEQRASLLRGRATRVAQQPLEAPGVDLVGRHREHVARRPRHEDVRPERLPQRDDGVLQRRRRTLRRLGAVELVDELLGRNHPARAQKQRDEQRTLSRPPENDRRLPVRHLERAEDPKGKHPCGGCSTPIARRH